MTMEWVFTPDDVARLRFAFSPLWEAVMSLRALRAPAHHSLHLPWIRAVRPGLAGLDLAELYALAPARGYIADFLTPPPETPLPDFAVELDRVRRTPPEVAAEEVRQVCGADPRVVDRFLADPAAGVRRVADALQDYWDAVFAEHWPRVYGLLEADVLRRSRRLATGGARELFADLHPSVRWRGDALVLNKRHCSGGLLGGAGLLLVPSAFYGRDVGVMVAPYRPMLVYPALGVGTLWEQGPPPAPGALAALIGRSRAQILLALAEPGSTTVLARRLALTPGAVSQHLGVLAKGGLVSGRRLGKEVVYRRTGLGDSLACAP
ncbi:DUF5937 family protein [Streptosporangium soli]|nr:winged helix-turn-helix domain-containing protein [Streptosporangium sp. KLBMP 9127]